MRYCAATLRQIIVKKLKQNPLLTYDQLNAILQPTEKDLRRHKMIEEGPIKDDK